MVSLAARFGFSDAALIPAPAPEDGRIGLLVLGSASGDVQGCLDSRERRAHARHVSMALHEAWVHEAHTDIAVTFRLSKLEERLLQMELEGLCTKAISRDLNLTGPAVESRFRRIRERLGVSSRRHAALLALETGLLDVGSRQAQGHDIAAEQAGRDESSLHLSIAGGFTDLPSTIAFSRGGEIGKEIASERANRAAQLLREALSLLSSDGSLT